MRKSLANELHRLMAENKDIYFISADLGYKLWDKIRDDYPDRFVNTGASEVSAVTMAVGLALEGKIPFVYTISSFFMRAAEPISIYLKNAQVPVILLGGGRNDNYEIDGYTHLGYTTQDYIKMLGIKDYYPETTEEIPALVAEIIKNKKPCFVSLVK